MDLRSTTSVSDSAQKSAQALLFKSVYLWMTLALAITAVAAFVVASSGNIMYALVSNKILFWGLLLGELGLVWWLSSKIDSLSFQTATFMFIAYSVLNGITMSVIFLLYSPGAIVMSFAVTAGTFGVMALYGTVTKKDLSSWGNILFMALIGIIIASVANWFFKSELLYWIVTYAGVLVFVGLTAYDSQKIKRMIEIHGNEVSETTQKIALMGALSLYLDFINLFLFILRIFGGRK